jgi:Domain of unknown function (DUF4926)
MIQELETVALARDLPEHGLKTGDLCAVVHAYADGEAFEVEFVDLAGETLALITVNRDDVRPVRSREIAQARAVA